MDKNAVWSELVLEISNCRKCRLAENRTKAVPGEGSLNAKIMFIGEAPGRSEDEAGRPFVGAAGKLLSELLQSINLRREDVFITNVVKCRPPENRDPLEDEILSCSYFTNSIIQLIQPSIIVTLGNHAGRYVIEILGEASWYGVSRMRGNVYEITLFGRETLVIPTYHPAAALYNPAPKKALEEDFKLIAAKYRELTESEVKTKERRKTLLDFIR
ncbi:MAG: type-4 uracil-DNA glycosylase [Desulfurococcaceae archaeon TW002]